ncbi:MAG: (d)CMP kinase [Tissierellia bacterium]|nr:(d)CMP kinase [Tissierellia bacterium]
MIITMDGPAGSGKSTLANHIARKLKILHVDSGSFYRALAFFVHDHNVPMDQISQFVKPLNLQYGKKGIYIDGKLVNKDIRSSEISQKASVLATNPVVRNKIKKVIRSIAQQRSCVVDGRDIGSAVLENADMKFYITASPEKRAYRRLRQLKRKNLLHGQTLESLTLEIIERDERDRTRKIDPLVVPENAIVIDTSNMTVQGTIEKILQCIGRQKGE